MLPGTAAGGGGLSRLPPRWPNTEDYAATPCDLEFKAARGIGN